MKDLIHISNPNILLIEETKLEEEDFLLTSQKYWKNKEGVARSARGAYGGIGTLWKKDLLC